MTDLTDALHIPDTHSEREERQLVIQRVGVKDVRWPLTMRVAGQPQATTAQWTLDVALPAGQKGTHMSRFVAWLDSLDGPMDAAGLQRRMAVMLDKRQAVDGRIEARFSVFLRKRAPVSGVQSLLDVQGAWMAETRGGRCILWAEVGVPVKSLCPCSKEISDHGAHNQRSLVTIRAEVQPGGIEWHELVRFAEESASSVVWALLKRSDEKWITERACENPKFVEDLVRDVALRLTADARIGRYTVDVENFHNHSACARIERL